MGGLLLGLGLVASGQSSTGSVYNVFGVGSLAREGLGGYRSMGNAGIGSRSASMVNLKNAASLNAIVGPTQIFDVDVAFKSLQQFSGENSFSTFLGGLENLNMWMRIGKGSAVALGAGVFSDGRYDITDPYVISPMGDSYGVRYRGTGGITRFYLAGSQEVFSNLNIGARASFLLGNLSTQQTISGSSLLEDLEVYESNVVKKFIIDFGAQYTLPVGERQEFTIGMTYRPAFSLSIDKESKIVRALYDSLTAVGEDRLTLPEKYGIGLEYRQASWGVSLDSEFEKWGVNPVSENNGYRDQLSVSFGAEFQRNFASERYINRITWRAGYGYRSNYTTIRGTDYANSSVSFGFGLPVSRGYGQLNFGYEYSGMGTLNNGLVYEQLHCITLNVSIKDIWFKRQVYD